MIERGAVQILILAFYILAALATTITTSNSDTKHTIGDGDKALVGLSAVETDNRFRLHPQREAQIDRYEPEETQNEPHKQLQARPRQSHRAGQSSSTERLIKRLSDFQAGTDVAGRQSSKLAATCERILGFWAQFGDAYPSLAAHLTTLGDFNAFKLGPKVNLQFAKQSIARHLEEAERLAEQSTQSDNSTSSNQVLDSEALLARSSNTSPANYGSKQSWLSRVVANPFYAKLVQYIQRAKQQQQLNKPRQDSLSQAEREEESDLHVYGRVVHYPHELDGGSGSGLDQTSRTLDKLRQLNQEARQLQQQQQQMPMANEIESPASNAHSEPGKHDQDIESNKIQMLSDGRPWQSNRQHSSLTDNTDTDSMRNQFVYGSVLLRPNQRPEGGQQTHQPLDKLRHLNDELDEIGSSGGGDDGELSGRRNGKEHFKSGQTSGESYGEILVKPPSLSDGGHETDGANQVSGNRQTDLLSNSQSGSLARRPIGTAGSSRLTLGKLRQQLEQATLPEHELAASGSSSSSSSSSSGSSSDRAPRFVPDEHNRQHGRFAGPSNHGLSGSGIGPETGNEFEGIWHAGPLQQVEVRQTRLDEHIPIAQRDIVRTTSSSGGAFLID